MAEGFKKYNVSGFFGQKVDGPKEDLSDEVAKAIGLEEGTFVEVVNAMILKANNGKKWPSHKEGEPANIPNMDFLKDSDNFANLLSVAPEQEQSMGERRDDYTRTGRGYENNNPLLDMSTGNDYVKYICGCVAKNAFTDSSQYGLGDYGRKLIQGLVEADTFTGKIEKSRSEFGREIDEDVAKALIPVLIMVYIRFPMAYSSDRNLRRFLCDVNDRDGKLITDKERESFLTKHAQTAIPTLAVDSRSLGRSFRALLASVRGENVDKDPCVFGQGPNLILYTRIFLACYNNLNSIFAEFQTPSNYERMNLSPAQISQVNKTCAEILLSFRGMNPLLFIATLNYSNIIDELSFNVETHIQKNCSSLSSGKVRQNAVSDCKTAEWINLCSTESVWTPLNPLGAEGTDSLKIVEGEEA